MRRGVMVLMLLMLLATMLAGTGSSALALDNPIPPPVLGDPVNTGAVEDLEFGYLAHPCLPDGVITYTASITFANYEGVDEEGRGAFLLTEDSSDLRDGNGFVGEYSFWSYNVPEAGLSKQVVYSLGSNTATGQSYEWLLVIENGVAEDVIDLCTDTDTDQDGVGDVDDLCSGTELPEERPERLKKNRFYANGDGQFVDANGTLAGISVVDTGGCSGEQIIDRAGLGNAHTRFGVTRSALLDWIAANS